MKSEEYIKEGGAPLDDDAIKRAELRRLKDIPLGWKNCIPKDIADAQLDFKNYMWTTLNAPEISTSTQAGLSFDELYAEFIKGLPPDHQLMSNIPGIFER